MTMETAWKRKYDSKNFSQTKSLMSENPFTYDISEFLLMTSLNHLGSLKSKWKSKWNYMKIKPTCKSKYDFKTLTKLSQLF